MTNHADGGTVRNCEVGGHDWLGSADRRGMRIGRLHRLQDTRANGHLRCLGDSATAVCACGSRTDRDGDGGTRRCRR